MVSFPCRSVSTVYTRSPLLSSISNIKYSDDRFIESWDLKSPDSTLFHLTQGEKLSRAAKHKHMHMFHHSRTLIDTVCTYVRRCPTRLDYKKHTVGTTLNAYSSFRRDIYLHTLSLNAMCKSFQELMPSSDDFINKQLKHFAFS